MEGLKIKEKTGKKVRKTGDCHPIFFYYNDRNRATSTATGERKKMSDEVDENMESTGEEGEYERTGGLFSLGIKQLADIREMVKRHMNAKLRAQDILNLSEDLRPGYSLRYYDSDSGCIK